MIGRQDRREIGRERALKVFESESSHLEVNSIGDREPVEILEDGCDVFVFACASQHPSCCMLYCLKPVNFRGSDSVERGITIVQSGRDERVYKSSSMIIRKKGSDLGNAPQLKIGAPTHRGYVVVHAEGLVNVNPKIANRLLEREDTARDRN